MNARWNGKNRAGKSDVGSGNLLALHACLRVRLIFKLLPSLLTRGISSHTCDLDLHSPTFNQFNKNFFSREMKNALLRGKKFDFHAQYFMVNCTVIQSSSVELVIRARSFKIRAPMMDGEM